MFQRQRRWPTKYRVGIQVGQDVRTAIVSDVSEQGMNICRVDLPDTTGSAIRIKLRCGIFSGSVTWHRDDRIGVRIDGYLSDDAMMELTEGAFRPSRTLPAEVTGRRLSTM